MERRVLVRGPDPVFSLGPLTMLYALNKPQRDDVQVKKQEINYVGFDLCICHFRYSCHIFSSDTMCLTPRRIVQFNAHSVESTKSCGFNFFVGV